MDPRIAWYQPEQSGLAQRVWHRVWETQQALNNMQLDRNRNHAAPADYIPINNNNHINEVHNANTTLPLVDNSSLSLSRRGPASAAAALAPTNQNSNNCHNTYYNRTKRKRENRASTYGLNKNSHELISQYGGTPWRCARITPYSRGTIG